MTVFGYEVSKQIINYCVKAMKRKSGFRASDIEGVAFKWFPHLYNAHAWRHKEDICSRIADRLIQKHRKEGNIKLTKYPNWKWIK